MGLNGSGCGGGNMDTPIFASVLKGLCARPAFSFLVSCGTCAYVRARGPCPTPRVRDSLFPGCMSVCVYVCVCTCVCVCARVCLFFLSTLKPQEPQECVHSTTVDFYLFVPVNQAVMLATLYFGHTQTHMYTHTHTHTHTQTDTHVHTHTHTHTRI